MENLILVWIFSCVLAWAFVGSSTSAGNTVNPDSFRKVVRIIGFTISVIALATTPILFGAFAVAYTSAGLSSLYAINSLGFLIWSGMHLSGALFNVISGTYRFAKQTI